MLIGWLLARPLKDLGTNNNLTSKHTRNTNKPKPKPKHTHTPKHTPTHKDIIIIVMTQIMMIMRIGRLLARPLVDLGLGAIVGPPHGLRAGRPQVCIDTCIYIYIYIYIYVHTPLHMIL